MFDDFVNLDALGNSGPVDNWNTFWRFITSGVADPIGRPLAMLSFLIDAHDWPADPAPFLRTNLLLHLINGVLLFTLLRRLERALDYPDTSAKAETTALLATGLWLLHPLFVSTTLYIVQREAMLPATFVLLGLLAYSRGRAQFSETNGAQGVGWMVAGVVLGSLLALLCKGNGILLPLLVWVLEATVFGTVPSSRINRLAEKKLLGIKASLLILPSVVVFAYLLIPLSRLNTPLANRSWTIGQRLLTEPRVIVDYFGLLLVPRSISTGLYNDGYVVSQSLWQPAGTLPALLLVSGLIALGFRLRARAPVWSAALLFFFAGHLLESTDIPLELYFEHRNYLPALLLFWPLARAICRWRISAGARVGVAATMLALLAVITYQRAELWGHPDVLVALWAKQNPGSSRAQAASAIAEVNAGHPERAVARLAPIWRQRPNDLQIALNYVNAACAWQGLSPDASRAMTRSLRNANGGQQLINGWMSNAIDKAASGKCRGLTLADVESWLQAALQNPVFSNEHVRGQNMEPLLAQLAIRKHQPDDALSHFDRALAAFTTPDVAARQAAILASNDYFEQALAHLDTYERLKNSRQPHGFGMPLLHDKVLQWEDYWPHEMALMRSKLHAAISARDSAAGLTQ